MMKIPRMRDRKGRDGSEKRSRSREGESVKGKGKETELAYGGDLGHDTTAAQVLGGTVASIIEPDLGIHEHALAPWADSGSMKRKRYYGDANNDGGAYRDEEEQNYLDSRRGHPQIWGFHSAKPS
jgi:hypothetical protein